MTSRSYNSQYPWYIGVQCFLKSESGLVDIALSQFRRCADFMRLAIDQLDRVPNAVAQGNRIYLRFAEVNGDSGVFRSSRLPDYPGINFQGLLAASFQNKYSWIQGNNFWSPSGSENITFSAMIMYTTLFIPDPIPPDPPTPVPPVPEPEPDYSFKDNGVFSKEVYLEVREQTMINDIYEVARPQMMELFISNQDAYGQNSELYTDIRNDVRKLFDNNPQISGTDIENALNREKTDVVDLDMDGEISTQNIMQTQNIEHNIPRNRAPQQQKFVKKPMSMFAEAKEVKRRPQGRGPKTSAFEIPLQSSGVDQLGYPIISKYDMLQEKINKGFVPTQTELVDINMNADNLIQGLQTTHPSLISSELVGELKKHYIYKTLIEKVGFIDPAIYDAENDNKKTVMYVNELNKIRGDKDRYKQEDIVQTKSKMFGLFSYKEFIPSFNEDLYQMKDYNTAYKNLNKYGALGMLNREAAIQLLSRQAGNNPTHMRDLMRQRSKDNIQFHNGDAFYLYKKLNEKGNATFIGDELLDISRLPEIEGRMLLDIEHYEIYPKFVKEAIVSNKVLTKRFKEIISGKVEYSKLNKDQTISNKAHQSKEQIEIQNAFIYDVLVKQREKLEGLIPNMTYDEFLNATYDPYNNADPWKVGEYMYNAVSVYQDYKMISYLATALASGGVGGLAPAVLLGGAGGYVLLNVAKQIFSRFGARKATDLISKNLIVPSMETSMQYYAEAFQPSPDSSSFLSNYVLGPTINEFIYNVGDIGRSTFDVIGRPLMDILGEHYMNNLMKTKRHQFSIMNSINPAARAIRAPNDFVVETGVNFLDQAFDYLTADTQIAEYFEPTIYPGEMQSQELQLYELRENRYAGDHMKDYFKALLQQSGSNIMNMQFDPNYIPDRDILQKRYSIIKQSYRKYLSGGAQGLAPILLQKTVRNALTPYVSQQMQLMQQPLKEALKSSMGGSSNLLTNAIFGLAASGLIYEGIQENRRNKKATNKNVFKDLQSQFKQAQDSILNQVQGSSLQFKQKIQDQLGYLQKLIPSIPNQVVFGGSTLTNDISKVLVNDNQISMFDQIIEPKLEGTNSNNPFFVQYEPKLKGTHSNNQFFVQREPKLQGRQSKNKFFVEQQSKLQGTQTKNKLLIEQQPKLQVTQSNNPFFVQSNLQSSNYDNIQVEQQPNYVSNIELQQQHEQKQEQHKTSMEDAVKQLVISQIETNPYINAEFHDIQGLKNNEGDFLEQRLTEKTPDLQQFNEFVNIQNSDHIDTVAQTLTQTMLQDSSQDEKKGGKKRRPQEEMKQLERAVSSALEGEKTMSRSIAKMNHSQKFRYAEGMRRNAHESIDVGYLRTVLFPETYSYDIPQPLTNISYARFTDRQDFTVNTGSNYSSNYVAPTSTSPATSLGKLGTGEGMIVWFPQTNQGPSCFLLANGNMTPLPSTGTSFVWPASDGANNFVTLPTSTNPPSYNTTNAAPYWRACDPIFYEEFFTSTVLVSASIQIQYTGQLEQESGIMMGSHIYGVDMNKLTIDDIEDGQYKAMGRPTEGLRFVYLPRDSTDYEYYPTSTDTSHNGGATNMGYERVFQCGLSTANAPKAGEAPVDGNQYYSQSGTLTTYPTAVGSGSMKYLSAANYIAIYWKGLPPNSNWLRVDITRKFNGVPKQKYRHIVEVSRSLYNFDEKKTFDILKNMSVSIPLGGHTFRGINLVKTAIMQNMENVISLHNQGALRNINSLSQFAQYLEAPETYKDSISGQGGAPLERVYDY